jgi:NDP-sugar pyrophosphorylase family protein
MASLRGATAVILAGGLGMRLRSVVADRPKVVAEVAGRPFLAYLLDQVARAGIREVVLCTGYLGAQVRAMLGDRYDHLHLIYSQEPTPLGTAGALRWALPLFDSATLLVMNGDSFCQTDLGALWDWHHRQGASATMLLTRVAETARYGRVYADADGRVRRFEEKGHRRGAGWINAGIYCLRRALLLTIPPSATVSLEQEMFPAWIGRGLYGYRGGGRFLDIGTPDAYAAAARFFSPESWP